MLLRLYKDSARTASVSVDAVTREPNAGGGATVIAMREGEEIGRWLVGSVEGADHDRAAIVHSVLDGDGQVEEYGRLALVGEGALIGHRPVRWFIDQAAGIWKREVM